VVIISSTTNNSFTLGLSIGAGVGGGLLLIFIAFFIYRQMKRREVDLRDKVEAACKDYLSYLGEGSVIGGQIFKEEEEFLTLEQQGRAATAVRDTENRMPRYLREENMRVLRIESVLGWDKMRVYEEINGRDLMELSYEDATRLNIWRTLLILSWRWGKPKPTSYEVTV
jgi:hypothetical protein